MKRKPNQEARSKQPNACSIWCQNLEFVDLGACMLPSHCYKGMTHPWFHSKFYKTVAFWDISMPHCLGSVIKAWHACYFKSANFAPSINRTLLFFCIKLWGTWGIVTQLRGIQLFFLLFYFSLFLYSYLDSVTLILCNSING